ncbi:cytochrome P460 family protein [Sphingomonas glacialis]|nr:cytochrome P460 family protein [Sphingomonas glacialis]
MSPLLKASAVSTAIFLLGTIVFAREGNNGKGSPIFGVQLPSGYRRWQVVSVAHEAGSLNDIRVILGNDVAMRTFRSGTRPFPDGAVIARLAWRYEPSSQNNAVFGQAQSFIAGDPTNVQIEVKDSRRYAATGGWGYGQFENGIANPSAALLNTCQGCHSKLPWTEDRIFTHYAR